MRRYFFFLVFFLYTVNVCTGQTGNGTNNQTPNTQPYQNPYSTQPYQNPYGNTTPNIFNNNNTTIPTINSSQQNDGQNQNTNQTNQTNTTYTNTPVPDLGDLNNTDKTPAEIYETYKDDPDYIKYLKEKDEVTEKEKIKDDPYAFGTNETPVYGANFFSNIEGINTQGSSTTVPEDYRLGPGDQVVVSVWGNSEYQNTYTIAKDGSIFPNLVGKIYLQGLAFAAARNVIINRFKKVVASGSQVEVSVANVRTIRVSVVGEVKKPQTLTISAFNTAINALMMCGGLTNIGNMRDIQLIRNGVVVEHLDLYQYMKNGNYGRETYLQDGDFLAVREYDKIVEAKGAFKRPMQYQMHEYETLDDLIKLAGGSKYNARQSLIRVKTIVNEEEVYYDFDGQSYFSGYEYVLRDGDIVIIKSINEGLTNTITLEGAVKYPDVYQIGLGERLHDVLDKAGGLTSTAYLSKAFIFRNGKSFDESKVLTVDLSSYRHGDTVGNPLLMSGDLIRVLSMNQFDEKYGISITGEVRQPGRIPYRDGLTLKDVLLLAGGLELEAESGRIEISHITDSMSRYSLTGTDPIITIVSINPNLEIDRASENIPIKPLDRIYVRRKIDIIRQKQVKIVGEVDYPGEYALLDRKDRLTDIIKRSGGLTNKSFPEGAKLLRRDVGFIVVDLIAAMKNAGGKYDLILQNGDAIIIPEINNIVSVRGQVQSPVNIKFDRDKPSLMSYVDAAGGFSQDHWKKRIYVRYQNGRLRSTKNFLFLKSYPKVKPGCTVYVPKKPEKKGGADLKDIITYTVSTTASLLTIVILALNIGKN